MIKAYSNSITTPSGEAGRSEPPKVISQAFDVVFAQQGAPLHLDDLQIRLATAGSMQGSLGDKNAGSNRCSDLLIGHLQLPISRHHNPVLTAMPVPLQAELLTLADQQAFDEIVLSTGERFVPTPGTLDPSTWVWELACAHPARLAAPSGDGKGVICGVIRVACCLALVRAV